MVDFSLLTREEVAVGVLGRRESVRMLSAFKGTETEACVVVAMEAKDSAEAFTLALELGDAITAGFPTWRTWSIQYKKAVRAQEEVAA